MCFICGGPHYTKYCPNDLGCPIDFDANPLVQPQPYPSQEYSTYQYDDPYQQSHQAEMSLFFEEMRRQQEEIAIESAKTWKILKALKAQVEPETTMDVSVPPLVQQEEREEYTGKFIIDFSCSNEEIDAQLAAYKRWKGEDLEKVEEEPLDKMEDENEEHIPSWEEEFGDELVGLPTLEDKDFDPVSDLAYLETLLEEKPTMEIKYAPNVEEDIVAEEFDSRPVEKLEYGLPQRSKTRERARKSLDQHLLRIRGWYRRRKEEPLKFAQHHPSHYMPRIRFGPGKFKYWWPDPFENDKRVINSTIKILFNNKERVELNGLDRGWIKEKPPD
ncbi:putative transcription factor interactor and regulator CCHC(Zn) family [Helianthus annuus]|uniref:Transcription factor interactor and regulator CCHC(Zn) family n=1 Tax=Helianthus annuus TaxID=4232 RepID=A0A9K3N0J2_HELAN|nr:putative transcription factor interactor and regulator CCHC(Zn) family [Helianthus annuus]KAJ0870714.1 putative transcription factor interactor and regulator CCHC(Zn) family [Helianthus annuus]KAJ0875162.1 hypothetical protein HanPSC8_Chr11g0472891 [Helianthus annuus]